MRKKIIKSLLMTLLMCFAIWGYLGNYTIIVKADSDVFMATPNSLDPAHGVPQPANGEQVYCIDHGTGAITSAWTSDAVEQAFAAAAAGADQKGDKSIIWYYCRTNYGVASQIASFLRCNGAYLPELRYKASGTGTLSPAEAYALTSGGDLQANLWGAIEGSNGAASSYASYAGAGYNHQNFSVDCLSSTIEVKNGEYIIGNFSITYGAQSNFSGLTGVTVQGYNKNGRKVKDNIPILGYTQGSSVNSGMGSFKPNAAQDNNNSGAGFDPNGASANVPNSGAGFKIRIADPNKGVSEDSENYITHFGISASYQWMECGGTYTLYRGEQKRVNASSYETEGLCDHYTVWKNRAEEQGIDPIPYWQDCGEKCWMSSLSYEYVWVGNGDMQRLIEPHAWRRIHTVSDSCVQENIKAEMELGGYVWQDRELGKETTHDGLRTNQDKMLSNIKVTLYDASTNTPAVLTGDTALDSNAYHRINPTLTDSNGYYEFSGLNPMKKYYVVFEYNGQSYLPTEYLNVKKSNGSNYASVAEMVSAGEYTNASKTSNSWNNTSKATENGSIRTAFNTKFVEIGSSPKGYRVGATSDTSCLVANVQALKSKLTQDAGYYYNTAYSNEKLMGYTVKDDGTYAKGVQLIDGFSLTYDTNGKLVTGTQYQEGEITKRIKNYISSNGKYPDSAAMQSIYTSIANDYSSDPEIWNKLQYIYDTNISAYTGVPKNNTGSATSRETYPVKNNFTITGINQIPELYNGQYYINLGLWARQVNDISLIKDVFAVTTKLNGETEVYGTGDDSRLKVDENGSYQLTVRMKNWDAYYGSNVTRTLYPSDYNYNSAKTNGATNGDLDIYVTYRISVRNQSNGGIITQLPEIVDYYDKDYTFMSNLSWVMYGQDKDIAFSEADMWSVIQNGSLAGNRKDGTKTLLTTNNSAKAISSSTSSRYGVATHSDMTSKYNSVYIRGLEGAKLSPNSKPTTAYIYLTFRVNKDANGRVILDQNDVKNNFAEINGYKTYYGKGTKLPNSSAITNDTTPAGLVDINSTPGNLKSANITGTKYEKNFENDTDRAKGVKIVLQSADRQLSGVTWEDQRNKVVSDAVIGDGIRQNGEIGINGITVQLVEKLDNNRGEYVWQETTTGSNKVRVRDFMTGAWKDSTSTASGDGAYAFVAFIPGQYIVRFKYGDTDRTVVVQNAAKNNGGQNAVSYNGQDFKSTIYSQGLSKYTDANYNITGSDNLTEKGTNLSDAKDIWARRNAVNSYSSSNVTNHKATVLASPYLSANEASKYKQELIDNTWMQAETGIIDVDGEYTRTVTGTTGALGSGHYIESNEKNGNYILKNIDFGLTERPKASLELDKKVVNAKLTLDDGTVLFDAKKSADNLTWLGKAEYNVQNMMKSNGTYEDYYKTNHRYAYRTKIDERIANLYSGTKVNGLIQGIVDQELMQGAVLVLEYDLNVKNVGEVDYTGEEFYYKGTGASASKLVTTKVDSVVEYMTNNLQFRTNDNEANVWHTVKGQDLTNSGKVEANLLDTLKKYNTILETERLGKDASGNAIELRPLASKLVNDKQTSQIKLVLTQTLNPQTAQDDMQYENIAEIVETSNTAGRRMAYSIVGNQDPSKAPTEIDASKAENVLILPPFGNGYIYIGAAVGVVALVLLAGGIVLIKKKILKK